MAATWLHAPVLAAAHSPTASSIVAITTVPVMANQPYLNRPDMVPANCSVLYLDRVPVLMAAARVIHALLVCSTIAVLLPAVPFSAAVVVAVAALRVAAVEAAAVAVHLAAVAVVVAVAINAVSYRLQFAHCVNDFLLIREK